jgi:FkbM family methyltransferase
MIRKILAPFKRVAKYIVYTRHEEHVHDPVVIPIQSKRLQKLFEYSKIKILDVGARGGPLSSFRLFADHAELFICEPDAGEVQKIEQDLKREGRWKKVTALPFALSSKPGTAVLHCGEKPGLSSLLEANKDELKKFFSISGWSRIEKDVLVPTDTLDHAAEKFGFQDIAVIKLDTQGTELDILKSGPQTLTSVLAVYVEMESIPLYKGQPLFHEVYAFLEGQGMRCVDLKRSLHRRKSVHKPIYSKREMTWTHGLYFRTRHADGGKLTSDEKIRLACIACAFEYFDYAVWLLEHQDVQDRLTELGLAGVPEDIVEFSKDFWAILKKGLTWFRRREILDTVWSDRWHER